MLFRSICTYTRRVTDDLRTTDKLSDGPELGRRFEYFLSLLDLATFRVKLQLDWAVMAVTVSQQTIRVLLENDLTDQFKK